jgi:hypothetical protein
MWQRGVLRGFKARRNRLSGEVQVYAGSDCLISCDWDLWDEFVPD